MSEPTPRKMRFNQRLGGSLPGITSFNALFLALPPSPKMRRSSSVGAPGHDRDGHRDRDVAGLRNARHVHVRRWLRTPSSNLIISPSNWVITLSWHVESVFDELKTHLRQSRRVLRSKTPDLVRQEFYGWMLAHYAVRWLMHNAAAQGRKSPLDLSFTENVHLFRRAQPQSGAFPPSETEKTKALVRATIAKRGRTQMRTKSPAQQSQDG